MLSWPWPLAVLICTEGAVGHSRGQRHVDGGRGHPRPGAASPGSLSVRPSRFRPEAPGAGWPGRARYSPSRPRFSGQGPQGTDAAATCPSSQLRGRRPVPSAASQDVPAGAKGAFPAMAAGLLAVPRPPPGCAGSEALWGRPGDVAGCVVRMGVELLESAMPWPTTSQCSRGRSAVPAFAGGLEVETGRSLVHGGSPTGGRMGGGIAAWESSLSASWALD